MQKEMGNVRKAANAWVWDWSNGEMELPLIEPVATTVKNTGRRPGPALGISHDASK